MTKILEKMIEVKRSGWEPLRAALGAALDPTRSPIGFHWDLSGVAEPDGREVRASLEAGMRACWAWALSMPEVVEADDEERKESDPEFRVSRRQAKAVAGRECASALQSMATRGSFDWAMDAYDALAESHSGLWSPGPVLSRLCRAACGDERAVWGGPARRAQRMERVLASPWWGVPPPDGFEEGFSDQKGDWVGALGAAGRSACFDPALAGFAARLVEASRPQRASDYSYGGSARSFGRELGRHLGREKIRGGALPEKFWSALSFEEKLGASLACSSKGKMGAWTRGMLISEASSDEGAPGADGRKAAIVGAFWLDLDLGAIQAMESSFGHAAAEMAAPAVLSQMGSSGAGMRWLEAEAAWNAPRAEWARRLAKKSGIAVPERKATLMQGARCWVDFVEGLRVMREAEVLKLEVSKVSSTATTCARAKKGSRL